MIKRNPKHQKQALLNKIPTDDKDTSQIYPPFEIQQCYSAVDHRQYREDNQSEEKDYSYYCLEKDIVKQPVFVNPYPCTVEMKNMGGWGKGSANVGDKKGFLPEKIQMNGNCYMKIGGEPQIPQLQQKLEEKKALCGACQTLQLIPKNSSKFICYKCHMACSCQSPQSLKKAEPAQHEQPQPIKNSNNGLFRCGTCGVKVQYAKGSSNYIRCTRCSTVNYVPQ